MSWIALVLLILNVVTKLPAIIEQIQKWLEIFRRVPSSQRFRERGAFGRVLRQALKQHELGLLADAGAVAKHVEAFALAYPAAG